MIRKIKNQKGVTLISLSIAILIVLVLTSILLYGIKNNLKLNNVKKMRNDIENLRGKVSAYYTKYGEIPAKIQYTNTAHIKGINKTTDTGEFYVIDLSALDNLTLNYGEDYEQVKSMPAGTVLSDDTYTDLYIINKLSHNIFYVAGITADGETIYTDQVTDTAKVDLKNQMVSIKAGETAPKGSNAIYSDGTSTATIPAGFTVSNIEGEKIIAEGLVIYDLEGATINDWETNKETIREKYNQFVWIPADGTNLKYEKHVYDTETVDDTQSANQNDTGNGKWRTVNYRKWSDWEDNGVDTESVEKYGGFYIGRYEAGIPQNASFYGNEDGATYTATEARNTGKDVATYTPVSKKNYPVWNSISQVNAKTASEKMYNTTSIKSSLIDSYAWDTVTTWMQNSGINVTNSTTWGNFGYTTFSINGLYALHNYSGEWNIAQNYSKGNHLKEDGDYTETATGITERNKAKNICDFAGNVYEWTTEIGHHGLYSNNYAVRRSGAFHNGGQVYPACIRYGISSENDYNFVVGFRVALYLQDPPVIGAGQTAPADKNAIYSDGTDTVTIPAGFTVSNINGEKTIADGLVIYDLQGATIENWEENKDTIRETYNQFVFIPVDGTDLKYQQHVYATKTVDDTQSAYNDTGNGNWRTYHYRNWSDWEDNGGDKASVRKYGGFYIGRYEAGIPEDASFYGNANGATYTKTTAYNTGKDVTTYTPVSKANYPVWNYISQLNAKTVSEKMYNNTSVKSSLIDSYAWDTVTTWLQNLGVNVTNSTDWGNHYNSAFSINGLYALHSYNSTDGWNIATTYSKGNHSIANGDRTETATGITERNKAKNIYDFAGNIYEWTTETGHRDASTTRTYAVRRGGDFNHSGSGDPACYRNGVDSETSYDFYIRVPRCLICPVMSSLRPFPFGHPCPSGLGDGPFFPLSGMVNWDALF